ncbi:MAG: polysaccharide biosynthesis/export family protein [Pirellulales bacterium]|nr:polysaccharide biosynthesis/export family protein [Pirellulales bacterium]
MVPFRLRYLCLYLAVAFPLLGACAGCQTTPSRPAVPVDGVPMPRELCKVVLPTYRIEPPDVLMIDAVHIVPKSPYHLRTLDALALQVGGALTDAPIEGVFPIEPGGIVKLPPAYGSVRVAGLTIEEAEKAIEAHLRNYLREPRVSASLAQMAGQQQITGEHLVGPDGTVTLGSYGSVPVVGLTISEARAVLEHHLSTYLDNPEISVDVFGFNSKVYYIVTQGAGTGDRLYRFPVTGNETVLDAISQINGLEQVSSKRIWIARPSQGVEPVTILPVSWESITACASANTNYQILPGDRVFIAEDRLVAFDTSLGKIIAPLERIMGFTLLGTGTATRLSGPVLKGGGNPTNNF